VTWLQRFTSKERDQETGLDYFGARYMSAAQGRFTSPDPVKLSKQRMLDPQQWNAYSYSKNNPLAFIDPDGREVRVVLHNSSNFSNQQLRQAARHIATVFQDAGVKVVRIQVRTGVVDGLTGALSTSLFGGTHHQDVRQNQVGQVGWTTSPPIPSGNSGHNFNATGGLSAIDTSIVQRQAKTPADVSTGIANLAVHEIAHDVTGPKHPADPVMTPPNGASDPAWLFDPSVRFGPTVGQALRQKYNEPGEKPKVEIKIEPRKLGETLE
jgi:RHS repeat-associated protein